MPFFSPIHNNKQLCIYIEMLQNVMLLNSQDLLNLWNASVYIHIYYLLEKQSNGKTKQQCPTSSTWKIALQNKNRTIKRGLERKNHAVKKLQQIRNEKCTMCEWDHWNSIGANPVRYRCKFVTSKSWQIRIMCVMVLSKWASVSSSGFLEKSCLKWEQFNNGTCGVGCCSALFERCLRYLRGIRS